MSEGLNGPPSASASGDVSSGREPHQRRASYCDTSGVPTRSEQKFAHKAGNESGTVPHNAKPGGTAHPPELKAWNLDYAKAVT